MKIIVPILVTLAYAFMLQEPAVELKIGATLASEIIPEEPEELTILHRRGLEMKPLLRKTLDGIEYRIAYEEKNHRIIQISTCDKGFVTDDGLKVGMFVEVSKEWFYRVAMGTRLGPKTKDDWYTIIGSEAEITILKDGKEITLKDGVDIPDDLEAAEIFADEKSIMAKVIGFTK